jgi:hypothetical protein
VDPELAAAAAEAAALAALDPDSEAGTEEVAVTAAGMEASPLMNDGVPTGIPLRQPTAGVPLLPDGYVAGQRLPPPWVNQPTTTALQVTAIAHSYEEDANASVLETPRSKKAKTQGQRVPVRGEWCVTAGGMSFFRPAGF